MGIKVGIDLGTTFSAVAYVNPLTGKAEIISNSVGSSITPSVVAIQEDGSVLCGIAAKELQAEGYINTASFFKRSMGDPNYLLLLFNKAYSATELSSLLLKSLVKDAEMSLGQSIDGAVITCPAYFRDREKKATIEAGKMAGINVISLLPEPTAASFAYGLAEKSGESTVLIYDLGGGTFDVTVAQINESEIVILGADGNHSLGGKDWDDAISRWIADKFEEEFDIDLLETQEQLAILTGIAETAKKRLTSADIADISVYYKDKKGKYQLSLQEFNDITSFMLGETASIINRLFQSIKTAGAENFSWEKIDGVILVGGSTRMRMVTDYVFGVTNRMPLAGVNADEAVALGAAVRANQTSDGKISMSLQKAVGAAPAKLIGGKKITDVTAYALGMISVSADGEQYENDILIEKNSPIPCKRTIRRQLRVNGKQENEMEVYVLQGSERKPLNCDVTGKYTFSGIAYVDGGQALLDITYSYNENGIIEVSAEQIGNDNQLKIVADTLVGNIDWTNNSPKDNVIEPPVGGEIFLICDLSGSMSGNPLAEAKKAMCKFVSDTDLDVFKIGIMGVADLVKIYLKPTDKETTIVSAIKSMSIGDCGGSNEAHPFDVLPTVFTKDTKIMYAVVLADGMWEEQGKAIIAAEKCHKKGIEIIGMGFGSADKTFMESISSQKDLAVITQMNGLTTSFSKIAQIIGSKSSELVRR